MERRRRAAGRNNTGSNIVAKFRSFPFMSGQEMADSARKGFKKTRVPLEYHPGKNHSGVSFQTASCVPPRQPHEVRLQANVCVRGRAKEASQNRGS